MVGNPLPQKSEGTEGRSEGRGWVVEDEGKNFKQSEGEGKNEFCLDIKADRTRLAISQSTC